MVSTGKQKEEILEIIVTFSCMVHSQSATADVLHMGVGLGMHLGRMRHLLDVPRH